jgi:AcrR family transcriptional regulator
MSNRTPAARDSQILAAALDVFARYGFRRASMADIARAAGLSRPLLYLSYPNKAAIFEAVSRDLCERLLEAAQAAWLPTMAAREGLVALAGAVHVPLFRLLKASPHGAELLEAGGGMIGALALELDRGLEELIAVRMRSKVPAGLRQTDLAHMLIGSLSGLKAQSASEADLVASIRTLAALLPGADPVP